MNLEQIEFEPPFLKEFFVSSIPVFQKFNKEVFLIGAAGRNFMLKNCLGVKNIFRMTKDADLAIAVSDFSDYNAFIANLLQVKDFSKTEIDHRFSFRNSSQKIDILPYSSTSFPDVLQWPPDYQTEMTMTGFTEACDNAFIIEFINSFKMRVVSPISLLILKFIAYSDRNNSKDSEDIGLVFKQSFNIYQEEIFSNKSDWLTDDNFDADSAGVRYLAELFKIAARNNYQLHSLISHIVQNELNSDYSPFIADLNGKSNYTQSKKWLRIFADYLKV